MIILSSRPYIRSTGVRCIYGIFSAQRNTLVSGNVHVFEGLTPDAVHAGTGMNALGAISLTPLKVFCPFRGLLLPPQMRTQGELILSRE